MRPRRTPRPVPKENPFRDRDRGLAGTSQTNAELHDLVTQASWVHDQVEDLGLVGIEVAEDGKISVGLASSPPNRSTKALPDASSARRTGPTWVSRKSGATEPGVAAAHSATTRRLNNTLSPRAFAQVRPTPGISCERPICSTLVCFIPLLGRTVIRPH